MKIVILYLNALNKLVMGYQGFDSIISEKKLAEKIAKGLGSWLMYEHHSYRADLFSEKYLSHGLGNLLSGNVRDKIIAEFNHPILQERKRGRPPQIDFVTLDNSDRIKIALESKWVGTKSSSSPSLSDILWDLISLEILNYKFDTRCFFIIAGKKSQIDEVLSGDRFYERTTNGKLRPLLPKGHNGVNLDLKGAPLERLALIERNLRRYRRVEIPSKISITGIKKYPKGSDNFENQVCVWSISKSEGKRFKYEDLIKKMSKRKKST